MNSICSEGGDPIKDIEEFSKKMMKQSGAMKPYVLTREMFDYYVEHGWIDKDSKAYTIIEQE